MRVAMEVIVNCRRRGAAEPWGLGRRCSKVKVRPGGGKFLPLTGEEAL